MKGATNQRSGVCGCSAQRQRLIAEHRVDHNVPRDIGIERVGPDHVAALGQDQIGILRDLELFVAIMLGEAHAGADEFQDIDDPERPIALVGAELAVRRG